jgi:hypothetical protein
MKFNSKIKVWYAISSLLLFSINAKYLYYLIIGHEMGGDYEVTIVGVGLLSLIISAFGNSVLAEHGDATIINIFTLNTLIVSMVYFVRHYIEFWNSSIGETPEVFGTAISTIILSGYLLMRPTMVNFIKSNCKKD